MTGNAAELIRKMFAAYTAKDRKTAEALLSKDFRFTSPYDDRIDKKTYFERCWPASQDLRNFNLEKVMGSGEDGFVRYQVEAADGSKFRNTEYFRVEGGLIKEVQVYFGSLPDRSSEGSSEPIERGISQEALQVFAGKWHMEGKAVDSPFGKASSVRGEETFEWLPGGVFLIHRLDGKLGEAEMACLEVIEADASSADYGVKTYYNNGVSKQWRLREHQGTWTLSGEWKVGEQSYQARCTTVFQDGGRARTAKWEYSQDAGKSWAMFWDTRAVKR